MSAILAPSPTSTSFLASLESVDIKRFKSILAFPQLQALKPDSTSLQLKRKAKRREARGDCLPRLESIHEKLPCASETPGDDTALSHVNVDGRSLKLIRLGEGQQKAPSTPGTILPTPPLTPNEFNGTTPPSPVFYATSFLYPSTDNLDDIQQAFPECPSDRDDPEADVTSEASKKMYLIPSMASSQTLPGFPTSDSRSTLQIGPPPPSAAVGSSLSKEVLGTEGTIEGSGNTKNSVPHATTPAHRSSARSSTFSTCVVPTIPALPARTIKSFSLTGVPPVCLEGPSASFLASKLSTFKHQVRNRWGVVGMIGPQPPDAETSKAFRHPPSSFPHFSSSSYRANNCSRWSESSSEALATTPSRRPPEPSNFNLLWRKGKDSAPKTLWKKMRTPVGGS